MQRLLGTLVLIACCIGPQPGRAADASGAPVGVVVGVVGTVMVRSTAVPTEVPLAQRDALVEGQIVRTEPGGRLRIRLMDGSTISLGEGSELRLDHLSVERGGLSDRSLLTLLEGYLRAVIVPLRSNSLFEVQTPSMIAGVRGTEWVQRYSDLRTSLFLRQGSVEAREVPSSLPGQSDPVSEMLPMSGGTGVDWGPLGRLTPVQTWERARVQQFYNQVDLPQLPR